MPAELRAHEPEITDAGRNAIRAALRGDFEAMDRLELEYLNLMVRLGELKLRDPDGSVHPWSASNHWPMAPFITGILRGATPDGRMALEWQLLEKCQRCEGKLRHVACRVCEGRWWIDRMNDYDVLLSDVDGIPLEGQE